MNKSKSKGFTIVEVLIAMVILAVGVLGLGVMQITSMQNTQAGQMKALATILAYDILDAMRANPPGVSAGSYSIAMATATPTAPQCYWNAANCDTTQLATSDVNRWRAALAQSLPSGNGSVATSDLGTTTLATVTINWVDPYSAADGNEQIVITSELLR